MKSDRGGTWLFAGVVVGVLAVIGGSSFIAGACVDDTATIEQPTNQLVQHHKRLILEGKDETIIIHSNGELE